MPRYSNSTDWNLTSNEIIESALRKIGVAGDGITLSNAMVVDARDQLNAMLLSWQTENIGIWVNKDFTLFLEAGQNAYRLGPGGMNATEYYYETTLNGDHDSSATTLVLTSDFLDADAICLSQTGTASTAMKLNGVACAGGVAYSDIARAVTIYPATTESSVVFTIVGTIGTGETKTETVTVSTALTYHASTNEFKTVTSITPGANTAGAISIGFNGVSVGDYLGVELEDGSLHWDIITAISHSAITATVKGILGDDADDGAAVYVYASKLSRPYEVSDLRFVSGSDSERMMRLLPSVAEYNKIYNKTQTGEALVAAYDPLADNGVLYVWPTADRVDRVIKGKARIAIQDVDSNVENVEIPREYLNALVFNLAIELAPEYEREPPPTVIRKAAELKYNLKAMDSGSGSIRIIPRSA